jgi:hypothetical protein
MFTSKQSEVSLQLSRVISTAKVPLCSGTKSSFVALAIGLLKHFIVNNWRYFKFIGSDIILQIKNKIPADIRNQRKIKMPGLIAG